MFQIFGYFFRCWVAMELPCKVCAAKMSPKSELIEIGGRCFLGSASILFNTAALDPSGSMARFVLRIWQGHTCWAWKGFNTGHCGLHWV
jgi:hypothetical protein